MLNLSITLPARLLIRLYAIELNAIRAGNILALIFLYLALDIPRYSVMLYMLLYQYVLLYFYVLLYADIVLICCYTAIRL